MPRQYSNKKSGVRLYGFEEYLERLQQLTNVGIEEAAEKCFNECADIVSQELDKKMKQSKVPDSIQNKVKKFKVHRGNIYMYSEGWNKNDADTFMKVCYLNYGTPRRYTQNNAYRGKVEARRFISNAKRAAAQRMYKVQKEALKEMTRGL